MINTCVHCRDRVVLPPLRTEHAANHRHNFVIRSVVSRSERGKMTTLDAFLSARDFLLAHCTDHATAYRDFTRPQLTEFNWAALGEPTVTELQAENARRRRELARAEMEREIIKRPRLVANAAINGLL